MKKYSESIEKTLVAFHISGGGGNRNKTEFIAQDKTIESFTDHLFMGYKNEGDVLSILNQDNEENEDYNESDVLDFFSDRNLEKLKSIYNISKEEIGEYGYKDCNGNWMDVLEGAETGTLEEDGSYDTTYVQLLSDCSENELGLILKSNLAQHDVIEYCNRILEIEEND